MTRLLLLELQEHLEVQGLQAGGIHAVLRGLRATFRWALEEELIGEDPTKRLRMPSLPREAPPAIQPDEVAACLKTAVTLPQPLRNRGILLCLYDCGLRMGELLALEVGDVDLETGVIRVRAETAKREKGRVVPVGIKASRAISNYERRERRPAVGHIQTLFLSRTGEPMTKGVLTHLMYRLSAANAIPRSHTAPHAWRRGFAVQYLRGGGDMFSLQQILGHSSLDMSRRYVAYLPADLQRQHLRASPGDRL
nr:tyrosine-type recombinase/integrase [Deinococcus marmoris]